VKPARRNWVVVDFGYSVLEPMARVLSQLGRLRLYVVAALRKPAWDKGETVVLRSIMGLNMIGRRSASLRGSEIITNYLALLLDGAAYTLVRPGDNILSSNHFALWTFKKVKRQGGLLVYDAGSPHGAEHWRLWKEQYALWKPTCWNLPDFYFRRGIEMSEMSDFITSPCDYVTSTFTDRGWQDSKLLKLPYGVDLTNFFPEPRAPDGIFKVVCTGTPCLRKGFPYLFQGFAKFHAKYPSSELQIRPPVLDVGHLVPDYTHFIKWIDWVPFNQLRNTYNQVDCYVLPSIEEGYARTLVEAMACGLPVITTANTVAPDLIVNGESGWIIPSGSAEAIYEKLVWVVEHPQEARAMGAKAREAVRQVRMESFDEQWAKIVEERLSGALTGP
jgi:glycosyltransferase involved in cell wall biosynthesis